ncbi:MAG: short-chain dehydrogenase, partial [Candidatus Limnocylindrales bacterium]
RVQGRSLSVESTQLGEAYDPWKAYGDSKLANYQFGIELARRLESVGSGVKSLVADPGLARTNLQVATVQNAGTGISGRFWQLAARFFGLSPLQGALPALRAATDPDAHNGGVFGPRWKFRGAPVEIDLEEGRARTEDTARVWDVSESQTGTVFSLGE